MRWPKWFSRFENLLLALNITNKARKKAMLLYNLGEPALDTVFPRFSAPGCLLIFEVFGGVLNGAGALIKTYENLDLPFPAHT